MRQARMTMSDAFSATVTKHREKLGLSRAALARQSGLHQTAIGLIERGERAPNLDTAHAIAQALGKSLEELISEAAKLVRSPRGK